MDSLWHFHMYSLFDPTPSPSHLSTPPTPTWTLCGQVYLLLTSLEVTSYMNFPTGDWYLPLHPQGFLCYLNGVNTGILLHRGDFTCPSSLNPQTLCRLVPKYHLLFSQIILITKPLVQGKEGHSEKAAASQPKDWMLSGWRLASFLMK